MVLITRKCSRNMAVALPLYKDISNKRLMIEKKTPSEKQQFYARQTAAALMTSNREKRKK